MLKLWHALPRHNKRQPRILKVRTNGWDSARQTSEIEPTACAIAGEVPLRAEAAFVGKPSAFGGSRRKLASIRRPNLRIVKIISLAHGSEALVFAALYTAYLCHRQGRPKARWSSLAPSVIRRQPATPFHASHRHVILECVPGCTAEAPYPKSGNRSSAGSGCRRPARAYPSRDCTPEPAP